MKTSPFRNDCDSRFFFRSRTHQAALLKLRYLIEQEQGAGVLAGATGLGKTYLTHVLARELSDASGPVVRLVDPQLSAAELLAYLAAELGADETQLASDGTRLDRTLRSLEKQLEAHRSRGHRPVLIVDDMQLVDDSHVFQALHLLLNFQHHKAPAAFSLILVGEPSLLGRIARIAQLNERLAIKSLLQPMTEDETVEYVRHRLRAAGGQSDIFDDTAMAELHAATGGVPRRINRLCDLALLIGYADKLQAITSTQIEAVAEEVTAVVPD